MNSSRRSFALYSISDKDEIPEVASIVKDGVMQKSILSRREQLNLGRQQIRLTSSNHANIGLRLLPAKPILNRRPGAP